MRSDAFVFSPAIREKLHDKHGVTEREVEQAFENLVGTFLQDLRERHRTVPPTLWFVAQTNTGRHLKVVFVSENGKIFIKSAFDADALARGIYERNCGNNRG